MVTLATMPSARLVSYSAPTVILLSLVAVVVATGSAPVATRQADLYVSPQGNDTWSGKLADPNADRTDGPVATVHRAQELVRDLKQRQPKRENPIVVMVRGGAYYLERPIQFGPQDSGTPQTPVIYRAYGQERPVLSGGKRIDNWKVDRDGHWTKRLRRGGERSKTVAGSPRP